jgi:hypothetical protein
MARNQNIELARIFAAFGIVLFHSGASGAELGYSGLIAFTALSTYFASGNFGKLAKRILIPWVFWSVFYLGWRYAADGDPFHLGMNPFQSILYGTHLWYLPFIFVVILVAGSIRSPLLPLASGVVAFALLAAAPFWRDLQLQLAPPLAQWLHALPAAFLGIACRSRYGMALAAAGLVIGTMWQIAGVSLPYAVGGGVVIAAILLPRIRWNVEAISSCMFGVYLVHIAALGIFNRISGQATLATALLAFLASLIGVLVVRRMIPPSRWVLG